MTSLSSQDVAVASLIVGAIDAIGNPGGIPSVIRNLSGIDVNKEEAIKHIAKEKKIHKKLLQSLLESDDTIKEQIFQIYLNLLLNKDVEISFSSSTSPQDVNYRIEEEKDENEEDGEEADDAEVSAVAVTASPVNDTVTAAAEDNQFSKDSKATVEKQAEQAEDNYSAGYTSTDEQLSEGGTWAKVASKSSKKASSRVSRKESRKNANQTSACFMNIDGNFEFDSNPLYMIEDKKNAVKKFVERCLNYYFEDGHTVVVKDVETGNQNTSIYKVKFDLTYPVESNAMISEDYLPCISAKNVKGQDVDGVKIDEDGYYTFPVDGEVHSDIFKENPRARYVKILEDKYGNKAN